MKITYLGSQDDDASEKPVLLSEENKGRCHAASIVDLETDSNSAPFIYSAASDGTLAAWDGSIQRCEYPMNKPKKVPKGVVSKFFPDSHVAVVCTADQASIITIIRNENHATMADNQIEFNNLPDKHVKAIAGYKGASNLRVFLGMLKIFFFFFFV